MPEGLPGSPGGHGAHADRAVADRGRRGELELGGVGVGRDAGREVVGPKAVDFAGLAGDPRAGKRGSVRVLLPTTAIIIINTIGIITMAADPLTTIPVRTSTRSALQRLKSAGRSYDDVIREILDELEENDPWFQEMDARMEAVHSGKVKLEPVETLYAKYRAAKVRRGR